MANQLIGNLDNRTLFYVALILVAIGFGYTAYHYSDLPDTIPIHYNASGQADGFSDKPSLWLLPVLALGMVVGMRFLIKFTVKINEHKMGARNENELTLTRNFLGWMNVYLAGIFTWLMIDSINGMLLGNNELSSWFLPVVMILPLVLIVVYMLRLSKSGRLGSE